MSIGENSPSILNSFLLNWFAGSMGGIAKLFSGQPFDIVKVRMQSQSSHNPAYKNPIDCVKLIYANEGLLTFYKGTLAPLSGVVFCTSLQFGLNELFKKITERYNQRRVRSWKLSSGQYFQCGAFVGTGISFLATPIEHIRIRMQNQRNYSTASK